jgi:hypothetical protein
MIAHAIVTIAFWAVLAMSITAIVLTLEGK